MINSSSLPMDCHQMLKKLSTRVSPARSRSKMTTKWKSNNKLRVVKTVPPKSTAKVLRKLVHSEMPPKILSNSSKDGWSIALTLG
jgi:hypothetical protein